MRLAICIFLVVLASYSVADILIETSTENDYVLGDIGGTASINCTYQATNAPGNSTMFIYWYKGRTVDDPATVPVFHGYWGYSNNSDVFLYYGDYADGKASVTDLDNPVLTLYDLKSSDEGRYWCMVTDYTKRSQKGTDASSTALFIETKKDYVAAIVPSFYLLPVTEPAILTCGSVYTDDMDMITWLMGPYNQDGIDPIGTYHKLGSYYYYTHSCDTGVCSPGAEMEDPYGNHMTIGSNGDLIISATQVQDDGRYWCRPMNMNGDRELETDQKSTVLELTGDTFNCTGMPDGYYPHSSQCGLFWDCYNGYAYLMQCYPGLYFNPNTETCVWPYEGCGECSDAENPPPCV